MAVSGVDAAKVSTLRARVIAWNKASRDSGTSRGYESYQRQYVAFCKEKQWSYDSPSAEQLCLFLMSRLEAQQWSSPATFGMARSAVADLFRLSHPAVPLGDDPLVTTTMTNICQRLPSATQKAPLTPQIVTRICAAIDARSEDQVRNYYMMLLMVSAFLRECEVVALLMQRVSVVTEGGACALRIEHVPAKKRGAKKWVTKLVQAAPDNAPLDIITWHNTYMSLPAVNKQSQYLFHKRDGGKLADTTAWHAFKRLFTQAQLDYSQYGSQSARRGGATAAIEAGVPIELIKQHGNWSSSAVERYIRPSNECLLKTTSFLNTTNTKKQQ